jgi:transposase
MLDTDKYYFTLGAHIPRWSKMKRQEALYFLEKKNILFDARIIAMALKQLVKRYVAEHKKLEIIWLAEATGHKVLFTFLYHSSLYSIELAWAYIKGNVGRQCSINIIL